MTREIVRRPSRVKYTKELLEKAVQNSLTLVEVLQYLGVSNYSGGMSNHIRSRIEFYGINTAHFLGRSFNSGPNHKGPKKIHWTQFLVKRSSGHRSRASSLRKHLIDSGVLYECSMCKLQPEWEGKSLRLEIDHLNRNRLDDRKENLRFLCPNCHSQV